MLGTRVLVLARYIYDGTSTTYMKVLPVVRMKPLDLEEPFSKVLLAGKVV